MHRVDIESDFKESPSLTKLKDRNKDSDQAVPWHKRKLPQTEQVRDPCGCAKGVEHDQPAEKDMFGTGDGRGCLW